MMGYDVYGIEPTSETGRYFRANNWWWRPLWHMICNNTAELSELDRYVGQHNDGYIIDGQKHQAVIQSLRKLVREHPEEQVKLALSQSPYLEYNGRRSIVVELMLADVVGGGHQFSWKVTEDFLKFCESNRGFRIS